MNAYVNQLLVHQTFRLQEEEDEEEEEEKGGEKKPFLFVMLFASSERTTKGIRRNQLLNIKQND
jgi:hypothetical protein